MKKLPLIVRAVVLSVLKSRWSNSSLKKSDETPYGTEKRQHDQPDRLG